MTGFEIVFTFYMFVNLMNLDNMFNERDARIDALESNVDIIQQINEIDDVRIEALEQKK